MKSPRVTGYATSSASVNGSKPSDSSRSATRIAIASESRPESSSTRSSVSGGSVCLLPSAISRIPEMTALLTTMALVHVENDVVQERPPKADAFEQLVDRSRTCERHLGLERAEKLLGVRHVAYAVDVGVFQLGRSLPRGEIGEIRHEALDEPLEER